ncbi:MAG: hypothetical protein JWL68_2636 [Actinomycetia bacterium]|nr:hypothetical protein [Actinomycetes bacterium]
MSDHHQPSGTRNADSLAAPETTGPHCGRQPGTSPAPDDETLTKMQRDFPRHTIWREITPGRTVYVARSRHPAARPHTLITPDLQELLAALTQASPAGGTR